MDANMDDDLSPSESNFSLASDFDSASPELDKEETLTPYNSSFEYGLLLRAIYVDCNAPAAPRDFEALSTAVRTRRPPTTWTATQTDIQTISEKLKWCANKAAIQQAILPEFLKIGDFYTPEKMPHVYTIPEQQFDEACIQSFNPANLQPLCAPRPDQTLGWNDGPFWPHFETVCGRLGAIAHGGPVWSKLYFPYCTIELEDNHGFDVVQRKNAWNGAILANNLLQLSREAQCSADSFNRILAVTISVGVTLITINYHWIVSKDGQTKFHSRPLRSWLTAVKDVEELVEIRTQLRNAIEWIAESNLRFILMHLALIQKNKQHPL